MLNESTSTGAKKQELAALVRELAVVHGKVILSSGKEADYYVDLRRATLEHRASRLIGELLRELTADWDYAAVGGLTLGADLVVTSIMHADGRPIATSSSMDNFIFDIVIISFPLKKSFVIIINHTIIK